MSEASRTEPGGLGEEQRDELVEEVAREIQLRGLTASAVHFLQASRPGCKRQNALYGVCRGLSPGPAMVRASIGRLQQG